MLPQKNDLSPSIRAIILCAGEGTRIKNLIKDIPKSMIRFEIIENKSILEDLIEKLIELNINSISIITGHLYKKIEKHIRNIKLKIDSLRDRLTIINTGRDYKLGPLHSFLTFTRHKDLYKKNQIYIIIPGDTIFDKELLSDVCNQISLRKTTPLSDSFLFFRTINVEALNKYYERVNEYPSKLITVIKTQQHENELKLATIDEKHLNILPDQEVIKQPIPLFVFTYDFIQEIIKLSTQIQARTLTEIINALIPHEKTLNVLEVDSNLKFFDVDDELDFKILHSLKK